MSVTAAPTSSPVPSSVSPAAGCRWPVTGPYPVRLLEQLPEPCLDWPQLPGVLFTAAGAGRVEGDRFDAATSPGGPVWSRPGGDLCLSSRLPEAAAWARYLGRRWDVDQVAVYAVAVSTLTGARLDRRGALPLPELWTGSATVVDVAAWVDPWAGLPEGYRASLRAVPF